jgi:hypothetical protein
MFVKFRRGLIALVLVLLTTSVLASESDALKRLQRASPNHMWDRSGALTIDIDSDGKPDYVFLSQDSKSATIGLVLGKRGLRVLVRSFPMGDPLQDGLCATPAGIAKESLDYDPTDDVGANAGFRRSKTGTGFILGGGECDVFHFFWNTKTDNLDWWRL